MSLHSLHGPELEWEHKVRSVTCPVCCSPPRVVCDYEHPTALTISHTGRYDFAASQGRVPALGGRRG